MNFQMFKLVLEKAAAKSLQSCPTLCDPIDDSPSGSPVPGDSPGKNTGVVCHFLLQCMKVKSESEVAQSCLTLSDSMDCSLPGASIHGIFQASVLEWGAIPFSKFIQIYQSINKNPSFLFTFHINLVNTRLDLSVCEFVYICVCMYPYT